MATHEGPELDRATVVLPAALWAEVEGTFTNYQRRVQRLKAAVPAPGDAQPRWQLVCRRAAAAREAARGGHAARGLRALAKATPDYAALDYRAIGASGKALPSAEAAAPAQEARA